MLLLELVNSFAYDVMSDVAFGKPMGLIDGTSTQETNDVLKKVNDGLALFGLLENVPWTLKALDVITSRVGPLKDWTDWSVSQIEARMALKDAKLDLVQHLIDNTPDDEEGRRLMHGDSRILIAAGSETIASALSFINVQLATHPQYIIKLRKELEQTVPFDSQRPLPLLDAVINESMRLWPSIFHGSRRVTPPEGITVLGQYIPGNMIVQVPPFPLNRDPRFFVQPDEFMPERWMDGSKLVLNKDAFMPFSRGPYSCAGKALAMMEMRSVVARVVGEFDIRLPEGFVAEEYWDKVKDQVRSMNEGCIEAYDC